jgi:hypothetical protein
LSYTAPAPRDLDKSWSPTAVQSAACLACPWTGAGVNATATAANHARANPGHDVQVVRTNVGVFGADAPDDGSQP